MMDLEKRSRTTSGREQRKKHAELILDLLVTINSDFKRKYGLPRTLPLLRSVATQSPRDVEMTAA
jgi:hypothetical protein